MREPQRFLRLRGSLILLCLLLSVSVVACGTNGSVGSGNGGPKSNGGTAGGMTATPTETSAPSGSTQPPLRVTSVDISISPSLGSYACGATATVTYTATFHFPDNHASGQVLFQYTTNNGRSGTNASLIVPPGQTTDAFQFTWSGPLPADHTEPGPGGVIVTAPNAYNSPLVAPTGSCSTPAPAAFKVTSIELSAGPSLSGHACGTTFTETYSAIFHIAPNGPGGTIVFQYTTDNGRSGTNATITVAAGQTSATYTFTWSGKLPQDHTAPGIGIVLMSSPNQGESPSANPTGQCT